LLEHYDDFRLSTRIPKPVFLPSSSFLSAFQVEVLAILFKLSKKGKERGVMQTGQAL